MKTTTGVRRTQVFGPALATAALLFGATAAKAAIVTVAYEARAATVVKNPFGLTIPLDTPITGYFTFDTSTPDQNLDSSEGEYQHLGNSGYLAQVLDTTIRGSGTAFYWVDLVDGNDTLDTFRIYDGPRTIGFEGGIMSVDGVPDETAELFLAVSEDVFDDDDLINPFPFYNFGFLGDPHTFTLENEDGTILMQFESVLTLECGDASGSGGSKITAGDALGVLKASVGSKFCYDCVCDVDHSNSITATDGLKTLKHAVGGPALSCAICD